MAQQILGVRLEGALSTQAILSTDYFTRDTQRWFGDLFLSKMLRRELPADKFEKRKWQDAAVTAADALIAVGIYPLDTSTKTRKAFRAEFNRIIGSTRSRPQVFKNYRTPMAKTSVQDDGRGWIFEQDVRHVYALMLSDRPTSGQADALLRILLRQAPTNDAERQADLRARRLFEQTTTEELEAMWNDLRINTLERHVELLDERQQDATAVSGALIDALADVAQRLILVEQAVEDDSSFARHRRTT